jgi:pyruvate kinase
LVWGVRGFYYDKFESTDSTIDEVNGTLKKNKLVKKGEVVVNTGSIPLAKRRRTNMLKVTVIE